MLAIISDLHLTDGTSGEIISDSAFRLFKNRLSDMAYDASWRQNKDTDEKEYRPIKTMDIILLGDILDMIRSEKWNDGHADLMPWSDKKEDDFYKKAEDIVDGILDFNRSSFEILKSISTTGKIKIPLKMNPVPKVNPADRMTYTSEGSVLVEANVYYMIGNHDWFFCIKDPRMDAIRNKVIDTLGLANEKGKPFPYHRNDFEPIRIAQCAHRVFAEHGDEFDSTNFQSPDRDKSSVGDVVVIKLLNAIPTRVKKHLMDMKGRMTAIPEADKQKEIDSFVQDLREIDNLRPYTLAAGWITDKVKATKLDNNIVGEAISKTLKEVLDEFANTSIIAKDKWLRFKMMIVSRLLPGNLNMKVLSLALNRTSFSKDKLESYRQFAVQLAHSRDKDTCDNDFFVMGHTHYAEVVPLSNYKMGKDVRSRIYINTGTWRSVHFQGEDNKDDYITYKTMSIAGFFKDDERKGRQFEFWTGTLAI